MSNANLDSVSKYFPSTVRVLSLLALFCVLLKNEDTKIKKNEKKCARVCVYIIRIIRVYMYQESLCR